MFYSKQKKWLSACLSNLLHDLSCASSCINYHLLTDYNPFSCRIREDLRVISEAIKRVRALVDDQDFQEEVRKSL